MNKKQHFFALLALLFCLSSCTDKEAILLNEIEMNLPGDWHIDSMQIRPLPTINHFGTLIDTDTVLKEIGTLSIPTFEVENLDLNADFQESILTTLEVDGVAISLELEHLFLSGGEYFVYLRLNDTTHLSTDAGIFIESTTLFNRNSFIDVVNADQIVIRQASGGDFGRMYLSRQK